MFPIHTFPSLLILLGDQTLILRNPRMRFKTPTRLQIPSIPNNLPRLLVLRYQGQRVRVRKYSLLSMDGSAETGFFWRSDGIGFDFVEWEDDGKG